MKKLLKQLLAVTTAIMMAITLLPAMANAETTGTTPAETQPVDDAPTVDHTKKGKIIIQKTTPDGSYLKDAEFSVYKIASLSDATSTALTYNTLDENVVKNADISDLGNKSTADLEKLASDVKKLVTDKNYNGSIREVGKVTSNDSGTKSLGNLDLGLYLVVETSAPQPYVAGAPFFVDVPRTETKTVKGEEGQKDKTVSYWEYNVTVHPKNGKNELKKQIKVKVGNEDVYVDADTVKAGDVITYEVTGSLPYLTQQQLSDTEKYFTISDTISGEMCYVENEDINVVIDVKDSTATETRKATIAADKKSFSLTLRNDDVKKFNGQKFTVTYKAKTTANFVAGSAISNTAKVESKAGTIPTPPVVNVYTFAIQINKKDTNGKAINGVTFELYNNKECTGTPIATKTTNDKGIIKFDGLDADNKDGNGTTYYLKETATKDTSYSLLANPVKVTLIPTYKADSNTYDGGLKYRINDGEEKSSTNDNVRTAIADIVNKKGFNLPSTGGMGTYIFTIGGLVVMAGAVLLLVSSKKKRA